MIGHPNRQEPGENTAQRHEAEADRLLTRCRSGARPTARDVAEAQAHAALALSLRVGDFMAATGDGGMVRIGVTLG